MPEMTGGQALIKSLHREGVRVIFGLPGVQLYDALNPLYDEPDIRFITTRHEQAAAYMAFGFTMAGGGIGTAMVVPGPGLQNASAGIGTAYAASCPIIVVTGQINRDLIGINRGELHEVDDQLDIVRPVTKWASRVLSASSVPEAVHEAFVQMKSGRPRPVEIEIPPDTLVEVADVEIQEPLIQRPLEPGREDIQAGAELLANAHKLLIYAGGGVISSGASEALLKLAEHLQAPVTTTNSGKGSISDRHYLSVGTPNYRRDPIDGLVDNQDLILAVGTRLARTQLPEDIRIVQIDIDPDEIGRNHPNTIGILGDARRSLEELHRVVASSTLRKPSRREELEDIRHNKWNLSAQTMPQASFVEAIRSAVPDDGIVIEGVTQVGYASRVWYQVYEPRTYITSSYFGNLGYAYPTALGAKVAQPDRAVVAISGDGGFLFNSQELATAVKYGINAVVIVFNDNAFGNVLRDQKQIFDGRVVGAKLHNPDFVKLAEAYGATGIRVANANELEPALRESLKIDSPTLIEVPVGEMPQLW